MAENVHAPTISLEDDEFADYEERRLCHRDNVIALRDWLLPLIAHWCGHRGRATAVAECDSPSLAKLAEDALQELYETEGKVAFASRGCADDRLNGQWRRIREVTDGVKGEHYFELLTNPDGTIYFNKKKKGWDMYYEHELRYFLADPGASSKSCHPISDGWKPVSPKQGAMVTVSIGLKGLDAWEVFHRCWEHDRPELTGSKHWDKNKTGSWKTFRGTYGETVFAILMESRAHDGRHPFLVRAYKQMVLGACKTAPELVRVRITQQPLVGQSVFHALCAAGDTDIIREILEGTGLAQEEWFYDEVMNAHISGDFMKALNQVPDNLVPMMESATPLDDREDYNGPTPLEIAMRAVKDDDNAIEMVKLLIHHGASGTEYDAEGNVRYNILHLLARSSWWEHWEQSAHIGDSRMTELINLFTGVHTMIYKKIGHKMMSQLNKAGLTPVQVAAMMGNKLCFIGILDHMKMHVWEWGKKKQVGFPLSELDSGAEDDRLGALELMTLHKHGNLLTLGIMQKIVQDKWEDFGALWVKRWMMVHFVCVICTALVCLDDTKEYPEVRQTAQKIVIVVATTVISLFWLIYFTCASDEQWFMMMDKSFFPSFFQNNRKVNLWETLAFRDVFELFLMVLIVLTPPWHQQESVRTDPLYRFVWHTFASLWFMVFVYFSLRYFELFHKTAAMALTIPEVITRDVVPFMTFYLVIFLFSAVAIRIACESDYGHPPDHEFGSLWSVIKTLEEGIHGPDVQWRNAVEDHPQAAGCLFVAFLWITLVMMSVLIGMFSLTFDDLRAHINERMLFRRAMFCITHEKLFPQWYHQHRSWGPNGLSLGVSLGKKRKGDEDGKDDKDDDEESQFGAEKAAQPANYGTIQDAGEQEDAPTRTISRSGTSKVVKKGKSRAAKMMEQEDRWLLWHGGENSFGKWKLSIEETDIPLHIE